jgi:CheY-like chemotaxis protein
MKNGRRILVVDDDPGIGQMLAKALARHGFQVDATTSADEALEKSESGGYDAALVDLVMPGRDGAELSETLRRRFPGLPIGLLTGYAHSPLIPAFEKSGMAVFKKPVLIQDLVEFLQRELGLAGG